MTITPNDNGSVILRDKVSRVDLITFGGAGTLLAGTILARDSVSGKFVPYVIGGSTNENGIPKAIVDYPVVAGGSGDVSAEITTRAVANKNRLVVNADGDDSNITEAILDQLRLYGIHAVDVEQLARRDNF